MKILEIKIYRAVFTIAFATIALLNNSCKKLVEIDAPKDKINTEAVFADSANASAGIIGLYIEIMSDATNPMLLNGGVTLFTSLSGDELYSVNASEEITQFYTNAISPISNNSNTAFLWRDAYKLIYKANACIEGLEKSKGISDACRNQLLGEALVVRSLCYFNLVNLYGDIPLVLSTDYKVNAVLPRISKDSVYKQIKTDLIDAKNKMVANNISNGKLRPNKFAALSLLSRVFLYLGEWSNAEQAATEVIASSLNYHLEQDLNAVFLPNSNEVIWQLSPISVGFETEEGFTFISGASSSIPTYNITNSLLNAFEVGDQRKNNWLTKVTDMSTGNPIDYYYPTKYKLGYDGWSSGPNENYSVFRLGELYLIRGEARAQLNNLTDAAADLNVVRERASLPDTTSNSKDGLLKLIYHERRVELFCEWGHRWFDLKRTGQIDSIMASISLLKGATWNSNMQFWPIPFDELKANPFLKQNPGYPQ